MANAKKTVVEAYTLELSPEEARALRDILTNVGGCPRRTRRQYADNIARALNRVGVLAHYPPVGVRGSVYFEEV